MGFGGTGGSLPGLLPLDLNNPDVHEIFHSRNIEEEYEVEKEPIARGKFASVRLARHRVTQQVFAAKFIRRRRRAVNLEEEARHEVAVLLLGRAAPHIVKIHQVFETRSEYIIILEFGAGGDLQKLLDDQNRLPEKTVKELLHQILRGLSFLHGHRIAHLDIKPQNLVLMDPSTDHELKLVDFGLSRVIDRDRELTQIMGTPDYVAPEIINYEPVGLATDMWAIGVLTYVFLTGYTPFGGENDQETFVNITKGEYDFPEDYFEGISEQAKDFIQALLIKSSNKRMSVEQCLSHPWLCDMFDPHRLSQLSEADSADSGYSTDPCTGSPPSPDPSSRYSPDLYQCSIPEENTTMLSSTPTSPNFPSIHYHSFCEVENNDQTLESKKPSRQISSGNLSINVIEALQHQHNLHQHQRSQAKPMRRSSLVIPRYSEESEDCFPDLHKDFNANQTFNALLPTEESENEMYSGWNNNMNHHLNSSLPLNDLHYDQNTLLNITKPWANLCNGSLTRALNQLNTKTTSCSSPKPKKKRNLGVNSDLSMSMFELKPPNSPSNNNNNCYYPKTSKNNLRKCKSELRANRGDFLATPKDTSNRCSRHEMRMLMHDNNMKESPLFNGSPKKSPSKKSSKSPKKELFVTEFKSPSKKENNMHCSSRETLFSNSSSLAHLNMSLSRLNLSYNEEDCESEERDVVYSDYTLPRRFSRLSKSPMLQGNTFHMSFRRQKKKKDNNI